MLSLTYSLNNSVAFASATYKVAPRDIRSAVTQITSAGRIELNQLRQNCRSTLDQSWEQLRYNWVRSVRLVRTVRKAGLVNFLRNQKFPVKTAKTMYCE
jgi:hypothetical protein